MKSTQVTKTCTICGASYKVKAYRSDTAKYCSKSCWSNRRQPYYKTCKTCGEKFDAIDHRAKFCSNECVIEWRTGDTSPVWKGGKSLHRKRAQARGDLAKWRNVVYKRDNYTCQVCGAKGGDIHAHHIKPVADFPELMLDTNNGQTLCVSCHENVHGRKFSTPAKYPKHCQDCGA